MIKYIILGSISLFDLRWKWYRRSAISTKGDQSTNRTKRKRHLRTVPYGVKQVPFKRLNGLLSATIVTSASQLFSQTHTHKQQRKQQKKQQKKQQRRPLSFRSVSSSRSLCQIYLYICLSIYLIYLHIFYLYPLSIYLSIQLSNLSTHILSLSPIFPSNSGFGSPSLSISLYIQLASQLFSQTHTHKQQRKQQKKQQKKQQRRPLSFRSVSSSRSLCQIYLYICLSIYLIYLHIFYLYPLSIYLSIYLSIVSIYLLSLSFYLFPSGSGISLCFSLSLSLLLVRNSQRLLCSSFLFCSKTI